MPRLYQLRFSARRRRRIFFDARTRRAAIRKLVELVPRDLVAYGVQYEHGHAEVFSEKGRIGGLRRSLRSGLSSVVGVELEPVWCEEVQDRDHARSLLKYDAEQAPHHDLPEHPALFDGSYAQDMLGARALPGLVLRVPDAVPSFRLRELHEWVGLPPEPIQPATDEEVRALGAARLMAAAACATAADPELRGRHATEIRAKRAVAQLARQAGIRTADVRWALRLTQSGVNKLRSRPADPAALRATRIRLALEETVTRLGWSDNGRRRNGRR